MIAWIVSGALVLAALVWIFWPTHCKHDREGGWTYFGDRLCSKCGRIP